MNLHLRQIFSFLVLTLCLSGCGAVDSLQQSATMITKSTGTSLPTHLLYVLVVGARGDSPNQLVIVDPTTWQVVRRTPLLNAAPWDFSRDPQGRIWIGYGAQPGSEHRVQVFGPDGSLLKTLTLCSDPFLTIHFAAGRAFVPCLQNGFHAAVAVIDLQSLEMVKQLDIRINGDNFLLVAAGGDEAYFVMAGGGQITNRVVLIDTHTLISLDPIPIPPSNPGRIFAYHGSFLLLNPVPQSTPTGRQDLLIIDAAKSPKLSIQQMAAGGALWGTISGDTIYTYHNAEERGFKPDPVRAISSFNLNTDETKLWPLPDHWDARDVALVNGEIVLTHFLAVKSEKGGLYRFDPKTGEVALLVNISGAYRILPPAP